MKKACLVLLMIVGFAASVQANEAPVETATTIGGGVAHPWKSPYRTAASQVPEIRIAE